LDDDGIYNMEYSLYEYGASNLIKPRYSVSCHFDEECVFQSFLYIKKARPKVTLCTQLDAQ
jgi:hypothetical protein